MKSQTVLFLWLILRVIKHHILKESENSTSIEGRGHTVYYDVEHTEGIVIVGKDGLQKVRWDGDNWALDGVRNDLDKILSM